MKGTASTGVLVVGHGSRRPEANDDVREAARQIGEYGDFSLVEAAFLELEHPNIRQGFTRLVERGARDIVVHPYFLSPGRHTRGDIPVEVAEAARLHPEVSVRISEPLSAHRLVIEASIERIRESLPVQEDRRGPDEPLAARAQPGKVYLVGAGPGEPGLLTVKGRELLESSDVVIYDYLVNPEVLLHLPATIERIYVGKVGGGPQTSQDDINRLLIQNARCGKRVVRLKGGDPFLFGRGAEEADALRSAGIAYEVVPGISSALAVPAYAGIPLTHRHLSSSVTVLTGARAGDGVYSKSLAAAAVSDTIVVLMGMTHLRSIAAELIEAGRPDSTPAAVIRWGSYEGQRTITGTLLNIADEAECVGMRPPAVIVIGEVVRLRERLKWFEESTAGCGCDALDLALT